MTELTTTDAAAIATNVVEMARDGRFDDMEQLFGAPLRAVVSAETMRVAWRTEIVSRGPVTTIGEPALTQGKGGLVRVRVNVFCERGALTVGMTIDGQGSLQGLALLAPEGAPSWTPPAYANPRKFEEQVVMVGPDELPVPGTLSLPHGHGKRPAVVLLPPMGPLDRDETSGPNKPLKDLAWGLASRGVAVLRFDMVTYAHRQQVATRRDFTMADEYIPYAAAAIHLLKLQPTVDPAQVFILGHSMGGKVAPRVAAAEPSIAGLVIMAGDTQPMQRSAVRVARYLARLSPSPESEAAVETMARQAALVDSPELSSATPGSSLPFGLSGAYWLDLRSYDPVSTAAVLDKPMFILQGGRDYQVTVEDDLPRWREGLGQRPEVTIRVYDADNHLFFSGTGPSMPAEYNLAQHVDPAVVADIAAWLAPKRGMITRLFSPIMSHKQ
ncbi:MAG TPA: alpha/beta fold hydrolase [Ktedonobacteraceae bacterium]|nr:alpha/beta fold hydrolase [Ktedonobacteraceae bacterium]